MRYSTLERSRSDWLHKHWQYEMTEWDKFDYSILNNVIWKKKTGKGRSGTYNDCIIMADTETSKSHDHWMYEDMLSLTPFPNYVVAWTISIRFFHMNIVTLYGWRPSDFVFCLLNLRSVLQGDDIYIYFHNMAYDWTFLRKFILKEFGKPKKQLNTKKHYPICIKFENNIILKDSLILSGCKLEKWAEDLNVDHQKAVGCWDYDLIRDQDGAFRNNPDELKYIANDTLAGVECIDALLEALGKTIYSIPYTSTGIIREEVRSRAKKNRGHERFLAHALTWEQQLKMQQLYHGGYTHGNRFYLADLLNEEDTEGWDFASSYPFCMLSCKFPHKFTPFKDCSPEYILNNSEEYGFIFKFSAINIRLKDKFEPMPAIQFDKCFQTISATIDNGRVVSAGYVNMYICEQDLIVFNDIYDWKEAYCTEVEVAKKEYLPRWFTDYIYQLFEEKTMLKKGPDLPEYNPVNYALAKARINGCYGLTVQLPVRREIIEVTEPGYYKINEEGDEEYFRSGEYREDFDKDMEHEYEKYLKRQTSVLNYQIGVYVTAYAFKHLFMLGRCVKRVYQTDGQLAYPPHWYYSDTDSAYSDEWDYSKIWDYNQRCKDMLRANGYGPVIRNGREYWLGVAEHSEPDDTYTEFKFLGSKRYAGRSKEDNKIHITVAGVPKEGADCLKDDLENFTKDFIFDGKTTGKLTHFYMFNEIQEDDHGNEYGDSIDLEPCDYRLDAIDSWEWVMEEDIFINTYGEECDHFEREF